MATRDSANKITAVTYQGSQEQRQVEVAAGIKTGVYWVGDDVFRGSKPKTPEFVLENTGVLAHGRQPTFPSECRTTDVVSG